MGELVRSNIDAITLSINSSDSLSNNLSTNDALILSNNLSSNNALGLSINNALFGDTYLQFHQQQQQQQQPMQQHQMPTRQLQKHQLLMLEQGWEHKVRL